jgi:integrase
MEKNKQFKNSKQLQKEIENYSKFQNDMLVQQESFNKRFFPDQDTGYISDITGYTNNEAALLVTLNTLLAQDGESCPAYPLLYLLFKHLPARISNSVNFVKYLLLKPFNFMMKRNFDPKIVTEGLELMYTTPFKGKPWDETKKLRNYFIENKLASEKHVEDVHRVILNDKLQLQQEDKRKLDASQIPLLIETFRKYRLTNPSNNSKLLYYFFIIKCLTGCRSEQLFRVRIGDVLLMESDSNVLIRYYNVKGHRNERVYYHTFQQNMAPGPDALEFDLPTLFKTLIQLAKQLCMADPNPYIFPFWIASGVAETKSVQTVNKYLETEMAKALNQSVPGFTPHRTRDVTVLLCFISNLDLAQSRQYLCHVESTDTIKAHYSRLQNQYDAYPNEQQMLTFGYLQQNIRLGRISVETYERNECPLEDIRKRGYVVHDETFKDNSDSSAIWKFLANCKEGEPRLIKLAKTISEQPVPNISKAVELCQQHGLLSIPVITPFLVMHGGELTKEKVMALVAKHAYLKEWHGI